ncbi:FimB/Mfa2 family fimbrial subunit [Paramuribaculum intestinale]|mgnify:FL=1|uniref:FimB/Mfa2 family fimbrial subunit n=3 Tax=Paramuribaculum intestinale TaxID=2094151 RepID=A0A2V1IPU2_9BACT|nr:FimB/Mfa2 family fimbrial subunit [Paramuribaculum intestinale]PWB06505.1 hypothetical protein C5O25_10015 [Paramuribaculum intestinale]PWB12008.1 hypothetical protein C5O24_03030 [Paramuribaculum intestinale]WLT42071.1 FimB/Mfa2 family fimbrial subunit [Paramuribaculum intestinale]
MKITDTIRRIWNGVAVSAAIAAPAAMVTSCDSAIYDDLEPCRVGAELRFVFDYNMEFANAFPSQVDCLTLYIYDGNGNYVATRIETSEVLADENWRMVIDLPAGDYHLIAYGGTACEEAAYTTATPQAGHHYTAMGHEMKAERVGTHLHDLYYGSLDMTVSDKDNEYTLATLPMMRDTNTLRILLQQLNGDPLDDNDFVWEITDDNTRHAHDNSVVPAGGVTYAPWTTGTVATGIDEAGNEAVLAYSEMSTGRFVTGNSPRLKVKKADDGSEIINIPLVNYLLLYKSEKFNKMSDQEYLDREHHWNMIFFLDANKHWVNTQVVINDWVVRINNADL